jgi:hypothetical protein
MKKRLLILTAALALAVVPAASGHPGHTSCAQFGAVSAELGQTGALAPLIRSVIATDPTTLGGVVALEHGLFCSP